MKKQTITVSELLKQAETAGLKAGLEIVPTPVYFKDTHTGQTYDSADGACGFAHVNISPARGKFVNYLKKLKKGHKSYYGGWDYWVSSQELGQSITRKEAYAKAFANVLKEWGINAMMMSRLD